MYYFGFLLLFSLSGCSSGFYSGTYKGINLGKPKIHLFLYGEYKNDSSRFLNAFGDGGYEVVLREGLPPPNQGSNFIIHSPDLSPDHFLEVDAVLGILHREGVKDILQYQYRLANHSYTSKNIGVYLL
ncbi:hypothetical protein [Agaribacterium sp. ZY112]|uniref:hypothetical protein n=1 Tax=Agaribacterium sp. ZY112 TaxID=3233574 RepID=UPI0035252C4B